MYDRKTRTLLVHVVLCAKADQRVSVADILPVRDLPLFLRTYARRTRAEAKSAFAAFREASILHVGSASAARHAAASYSAVFGTLLLP